MKLLTPGLLAKAVGCSVDRAAQFSEALSAACEAYQITTPARLAAFLAQISHESGALRYTSELWGPTPEQQRYEGRADLGNVQPGDGVRFKGRGLIQTTGRYNYGRTTLWLRVHAPHAPDFVLNPEALELPGWAAWSAAAYWYHNKLNALADAGEFTKIGRAINRGNPNSSKPANGEEDRLARWERAKSALAAADAAPAPQPKETPVVAPIVAAMATPFLGAAASALADAIPKLGTLFAGESPTAKRNVAAATLAVDVVKQALGVPNEQALVEKIQADPEAVAVAQQAVEENWYRLHEASEKSIAAAREHAARYSQMKDVRTVAGSFTFIELLSLIMVVPTLLGGMAMVIWGDLTQELKGAVVTMILIGGFVGVKEFWLGSSHGSKAKDNTDATRTG